MNEETNRKNIEIRIEILKKYIEELKVCMSHYLSEEEISNRIDRLYRSVFSSDLPLSKEEVIAFYIAPLQNSTDVVLDSMISSDDGDSKGICLLDDDKKEISFKGLNDCIKERITKTILFSFYKSNPELEDEELQELDTLPTIKERVVSDMEDILGKGVLFRLYFTGDSLTFERMLKSCLSSSRYQTEEPLTSEDFEFEVLSNLIDDSVYNKRDNIKSYSQIIEMAKVNASTMSRFDNPEFEEKKAKVF